MLDRKQIIVTGAAGGIGSLVAARLRRAGAIVTGIDRVPCPACKHSITGDLGSEAGIAAIADKVRDVSCDILVNLAGVQYFGPLAEQPLDGLWGGYVVNLIAPAMLVRAVLPGMMARGSGRIVNIGSVFGAIPFAHFASYSSAKAGLKALSDALRRELAGSGIAVTHIAPRAVRTKLASPKVMAFAAATKMHMDEPDAVAERIVEAIDAGARDVVIGFSERLFVRVNALAPRLIDRALAANDRKAAALFR
jgi:short-subunit dehydrogenase